MSEIAALVADNLDIWTGAIERKNGAGRGGGKRISLYGIERLRALILDLAVSGKLVPQDARDEPAGELLKRIKTDRARLIKAKAIGKGKSLPPVTDEPPFAVPANWVWTQVSEIGHDWGQKEPTADFTYIDVGSINQRLGAVQSPNVVSASDAPSRARKVVQKGTVIYSTVRPYLLNIAVIDQDFDPEPIASTAFAIIHPFAGIEAGFIYRYLRSPSFVSYVESCQTGIAYPAINDRQFFAAWCPLPPLAEQRRIVAKVDELMALCDVLERESADALAAHQTLVETLLATLVNSADAADLATNWARLESHFDTLFTTEASINALKQTILDLAVRGKLVEQDSRDEPAIKKLKGTQATAPFSIPENWQCVPLQALGRQIGGGTPSKSRSDFWDGPIPWVSPKDMKRDYLSAAEMSVTESALKGSAVKLIAPESLMFVVRGMILAHSFPVAITKGPVTINQDMKAIELDQPAMAEYLLRALKGLKPLMLARVERSSHGTCRLDANAYGSFPIPIPPVAEQRRIVARIDELMALCDALMARIIDAAETRRHLADAITRRAAA